MEEFVDYVMEGPFADALPGGVYSNPVVGTLHIKTRNIRKCGDGLFADDCWPGAVVLSDYFSSHQEEVESKRILELGAGAALPSLVCCRLGASFVLITDFPDDDIISNINDLVKHNSVYGHCEVCGYIWGDDVKGLLSAGVVSGHGTELYDVIIMAELLWGDTYSLHENILTSACQCLKQDGAIYVSFAKRPLECTSSLKGQHDDDDFFRLAVKFGLSISEISCTKMSDVCSTEKVDVRLIILRKCGMKHSCSDSNRK